MNKRRILLSVVFALFLVAAAVASLVLWQERYTPERWREASWNERQVQVPSLLRQVDFIGRTREDIIGLLGPETSDDPTLDPPCPSAYRTPYNLVYDFGQKRGSMASNIALLFFFTEDGFCEGYYLLTYSW